MAGVNYPLPRPDAHTKPFWDGAQQGELRYQQCGACGCVQLIPRSLCEQCQHSPLEWRTSQGSGRVLTFTTVHRAPLPVFRDMVPYVIAIVDMEEGFRIMANSRPDIRASIDIGSRVRIGFHDIEGMALPIVDAVLE